MTDFKWLNHQGKPISVTTFIVTGLFVEFCTIINAIPTARLSFIVKIIHKLCK